MNCKQQERQHNWANNLTYGTDSYFEPSSIAEVQDLIGKYDKLKVLGTKHSFNTIANSTDHLISLRKFDEVILNKDSNTVTVGAGISYGKLSEYLEKEGYALHNLASLPHISVAGACATATHGSGVKNGNLSTAVAAIEFISAGGEIVTLSEEKNAEQFAGAVVNLGAIGVVTRVTLRIQPTFQVRQDVYQFLPLSEMKEHLDEVLGLGYSVSLFTDWKDHSFNQVWVKSRVEPGRAFNLPATLFGANPATKNLHPIVALSAVNCTEQMGVPGPWFDRLPHFKMNFTPSSGEELQAEYFVPREHAYEALMAIDAIGHLIEPHLFISEIRTIDADNLWMSPCYHQPCLSIHFTWKPDWPSVSKVLPVIEEKLAPFGARPHWAKLFTMGAGHLKSLYPKLAEFKKLCATYDPKGKFKNEFLTQNVF